MTVAVLLTSSLAGAAGDPENGRKLAYTCHGCHGIENYKNAYPNYSVPKLGGQHEQYIVAALVGFAWMRATPSAYSRWSSNTANLLGSGSA